MKSSTQAQALHDGANVFNYGRLSRDEDKDLNSLTNQMDILRDYALVNGYNIVGESFDDNVSGMTFDREGLDRMMDMVQEGKVNAILVKDLSRLGRHRIKTAVLIEQLERKGVRVLSVTENIDTFDENDDLMIGIKQIMNDFYAKDIQRKIRFGYRQKQKVGLIMIPPFGYFKDKNTGLITVVEEAAATVRRIYHLFLDGMGYKKIAQALNREGARSPSTLQYELLGKKVGLNKTKVAKTGRWNEKSIERILKDEAYIGTLINHKSETNKIKKTYTETAKDQQFRHEGVFPPIIEDTIWCQVQTVIEARKVNKPRASTNSKIHRYAGLLRCGDCEASFAAKRRSYKGNNHIEYVCSTYHRMGKVTCTSHRIKESDLDELLNLELRRLLTVADHNCDEVENVINTYLRNKNEAKIQAKHLRVQLAGLQDDASKKVGYLALHPELEDMLMPDILRTRDEIQLIKERITLLDVAEISYKSRLEDMESSREMLREIVDAKSLSNATLVILVERIIIHSNEDGTLDIRFRLRGPFQSHYILSKNIQTLHQADSERDHGLMANALAEILQQIA